MTQENPNAVQEHQAAEVHARETPQDREEVGERGEAEAQASSETKQEEVSDPDDNRACGINDPVNVEATARIFARSYTLTIIDDPVIPPLFELDIDRAWSKPVRVTPYVHPDRLFGRLEVERERMLNEQQNLYAMIHAQQLEIERTVRWVMYHRRQTRSSR